jgi:hypothetical protein
VALGSDFYDLTIFEELVRSAAHGPPDPSFRPWFALPRDRARESKAENIRR